MNKKQYIQQKRQYITPSIRIVQIELEGVMGAATADATGDKLPGDGGNFQFPTNTKSASPIINDDFE